MRSYDNNTCPQEWKLHWFCLLLCWFITWMCRSRVTAIVASVTSVANIKFCQWLSLEQLISIMSATFKAGAFYHTQCKHIPLLIPVYEFSLLSTSKTKAQSELEYSDIAVCSRWGWGTIVFLKNRSFWLQYYHDAAALKFQANSCSTLFLTINTCWFGINRDPANPCNLYEVAYYGIL